MHETSLISIHKIDSQKVGFGEVIRSRPVVSYMAVAGESEAKSIVRHLDLSRIM